MNPRRLRVVLSLFSGLVVGSGCGWVVETDYGRSRDQSVNGTGVLADVLREAGHSVRVARLLTDDVSEEAETIVRFAPRPGSIDQIEADWYAAWQESGPDRRLIYVCRDYDAESDYWESVLAGMSGQTSASNREKAQQGLATSKLWVTDLPEPIDDPASPALWFELTEAVGLPVASAKLEGEWSEGIDAEAASLPRRGAIRMDGGNVLLRGDGRALAVEWSWESDADEPGRVLVLANGGFLLNGALLARARRPLLTRTVEWLAPPPRRIIFVEGDSLFVDAEGTPSLIDLARRLPSLTWIALHFIALGAVAALAKALSIGRVPPPPSSGSDRPKAHAEALGALLARSGDSNLAREQLEAYRRWRYPLSRLEE